ncbi:hypothetical protein AMATHDRAFT_8419 [Amanita thiersii Skay4041]|uniref:DUF4238 domain-containing protein n=1 Tax=Amanita thiersii Skay4041 TaxID=703135 RepID=A0A2A9NEA1_9AGAR|nr:hypothetical protein AMATHDRAFT_8419 [Amanita thiersii Skay4041]
MSTDNQYLHYIPRFVLRRFHVQAGTGEEDRQEPKQRANGKKRGRRNSQAAAQEVIHYFDLDTVKLETRTASGVYGVLQKNVKGIGNFSQLEQKLSHLETEASTIVEKIHDSLDRGRFQIERRQLEDLRRYLFIMQYRRAIFCQDECTNDGHPDSAAIASWITRVKQTTGIDSPAGVWFHFLGTLLDTPHKSLLSRYRETKLELHNKFGFLPLLEDDLDDYASADYATFAEYYFLGVVAAATDTEFIVSNNSFGIWEGSFLEEVPGVHRVFVISPRVAILLRNNRCKSPFVTMSVDSDLFDIPIAPAQVEYAGGKQFMFHDEMMEHRMSRSARRDAFKFTIVKLTKPQTMAVNNLIMLNVTEKGSVTFRSRDAMVESILMYRYTFHPLAVRNRHQFASLANELMGGSGRREGSGDAIGNRISGPPNDQDILDIFVNGEVTFNSDYDRAYHIYNMASDEVMTMIVVECLGRQLVYERMPALYREPIDVDEDAYTNPFAKLVETLPKADSEKVMTVMKELVPPGIRRSHNPNINELLHQVTIVGVLDWLAKNREDVLERLFPDIQFIASRRSSRSSRRPSEEIYDTDTSLDTSNLPGQHEQGSDMIRTVKTSSPTRMSPEAIMVNQEDRSGEYTHISQKTSALDFSISQKKDTVNPKHSTPVCEHNSNSDTSASQVRDTDHAATSDADRRQTASHDAKQSHGKKGTSWKTIATVFVTACIVIKVVVLPLWRKI